MRLLMAMCATLGPRFGSRRGFNWEIVLSILCVWAVFFVRRADGLGSMSTIAASHSGNTSTVCGIMRGGDVRCWGSGNVTQLRPVGILGISAGDGVVCGLTQDRLRFICWNTTTWARKRLMNGSLLSEMGVGETHACGLFESNGLAYCWRGEAPPGGSRFTAIAVGSGFSCGIENQSRVVQCWGRNAPSNGSTRAMSYISAGVSHVCGIRTDDGRVTCWGESKGEVPAHQSSEFDSLALGANHTCARRRLNGTVVCWGPGVAGGYPQNISFEVIVAGDGYTCGVVTWNLTVLCWGGAFGDSFFINQLSNTLPGLCQASNPCPCGVYPDSDSLCGSSRIICRPCPPPPPPPPPTTTTRPPPPVTPAPSSLPSPRVVRKMSQAAIVLTVVGSIGALLGLGSVIWWVYFKFFRRARRRSGRVCDAEQQQQQPSSTTPASSADRFKQTSRQTSRRVRRQRSGTSNRPEEFSFLDLSLATSGFSDDSKIGSGSFGTVYRGTLPDGRWVAIKRSETLTAKKNLENESAFESELSFMSRLHHKHLLALVGYCEEDEERLLVYDYMPHGSLHDHLHKSAVIHPPLDSWAVRIKVALDAARGIEYLHTYAVPAIIHRDIKSSNILLDGSWNAKVSDFGLSLRGPNDENSHLSLMAAGTVGYMDPEYYRLQHLTTKSDVYSFGVVLLELLTGKKAIHRLESSGGPINVVDYALPHIDSDDLPTILDDRVPPPRPYEIEAVSFVASTAADCVNLEGKDRPSMTEVVANLETALAFSTRAAISASMSRSLHSEDDHFSVL